MFKGLAPVSGGFGMKMLKKMGWEEGCPLGRSGQGHIAPIEVEVKMDRHGGCGLPRHGGCGLPGVLLVCAWRQAVTMKRLSFSVFH